MKVTGIGGGHGLAATLRAARRYAEEVCAVVTVADDGGSSGRLTTELGIPPPGDIRNCLVALARDEATAALFQHRFQSGALTGHTVGNLIIAALTEMTGDFTEAVREAGRRLDTTGDVFPATTALVDMRARVKGGVVKGQVAVAQTTAPIQAVYLEPPDPPGNPLAVEAIRSADQVILGPGSLFTSLIATLLVPSIRTAVQETSAKRVFVCNVRQQKGETEGLDAAAHVDALMAHAGAYCLDAVVVQAPVATEDAVPVDMKALLSVGIEVVEADVMTPDGAHDPERLADVLRAIV
ncbi:MAG TPA: uridine diphosphate-N-acetylglucosamine-binding protein YvcK [Actinomycetota bacterium]|nr:uridine diphosphate-N-acetylglucosamine-binding protein YvcK [Actinomycetota bacterium]